MAAKNYRNGALNPKAFRRKPITEEEILSSQMLNYPLTSYMFCAPDEGAAAVVLCRADIAHRYTDTPVYVKATAIRTRNYGAYEVNTTWAPVEEDVAPTVYASRAAYEEAGIGPEDVDVIQLQDTDAGAEVIHMAENGFCADGDQEKLLADGATEITGPMPINTDGGLIANGEPIGASGLRQVHELVLQLRGQGRRPPGPGRPARRLRPGLRGPRHRRRHDPRPLRAGWSVARACLVVASRADPRGRFKPFPATQKSCSRRTFTSRPRAVGAFCDRLRS